MQNIGNRTSHGSAMRRSAPMFNVLASAAETPEGRTPSNMESGSGRVSGGNLLDPAIVAQMPALA